MKKLLAFGIIVLVAVFTTYDTNADDAVTMQCNPPTHRVANNDCAQQGTPLTAEEIESLEYTFSYRQKGVGASWTNIDSNTPITSITLIGYGVTYEAVVGARFPGEAILCATEPIEYTTGPDTSPPGACSAFTITK